MTDLLSSIVAKLRGNSIDDNQEDDECNVSVVNYEIDFRLINNPFVIIIGIYDYKLPNKSLPAVIADINNMKDLWRKKFNYKHVSCITDDVKSGYIDVKTLNSYLNDKSSSIQINKNVDGLIIVYSGHGGINGANNYVICSDNKAISLKLIQDKFASEACDYLANKPKMFYMDCCRGKENIKTEDIKECAKGSDDRITYVNKLSDFFVHFSTCNNYISWTKNDEEGSYLINAIYKCYIHDYGYHVGNLVTLNETSIKINSIINQTRNGKQTSEIVNRLVYDVYIQPFNADYTNSNVHKVISKMQMKDKIELLQQQLKQEMISHANTRNTKQQSIDTLQEQLKERAKFNDRWQKKEEQKLLERTQEMEEEEEKKSCWKRLCGKTFSDPDVAQLSKQIEKLHWEIQQIKHKYNELQIFSAVIIICMTFIILYCIYDIGSALDSVLSIYDPNECMDTDNNGVIYELAQQNKFIVYIINIMVHIATLGTSFYVSLIQNSHVIEKIISIILWMVCQFIIAWNNSILSNIVVNWKYVIIFEIIIFVLYKIAGFSIQSQDEDCCGGLWDAIYSLIIYFLILIIIELFWIISCGDFTSLGVIIFLLEGLCSAYSESFDLYFVVMIISKLPQIIWMYVYYNWILALCELLTFPLFSILLKVLHLRPESHLVCYCCVHFCLYIFVLIYFT